MRDVLIPAGAGLLLAVLVPWPGNEPPDGAVEAAPERRADGASGGSIRPVSADRARDPAPTAAAADCEELRRDVEAAEVEVQKLRYDLGLEPNPWSETPPWVDDFAERVQAAGFEPTGVDCSENPCVAILTFDRHAFPPSAMDEIAVHLQEQGIGSPKAGGSYPIEVSYSGPGQARLKVGTGPVHRAAHRTNALTTPYRPEDEVGP